MPPALGNRDIGRPIRELVVLADVSGLCNQVAAALVIGRGVPLCVLSRTLTLSGRKPGGKLRRALQLIHHASALWRFGDQFRPGAGRL